MRQKSILWSLLAIVLVASLSAGSMACKNDKDDDAGIIGIWTGVDGSFSLSLTFNSNNTGTWISKYQGSGTSTDSGTFTYSMSGSSKGTIIVKNSSSYSYSGSSSSFVYTFIIEGKTMLLYNDSNNLIMALKKGVSGNTIDDDYSITGTWSYSSGNNSFSMTFNNNGSGTWTERYYDSYSGIETNSGSFTYSMNGTSAGTITVKFYDSYSGNSSIVLTFKIVNGKMYLYDNSGTVLFVLTKQ